MNGKVPLHSRLFAQWMHHAYPQECPFPHSVRGQSTLTPEDWSAQTGLEHSLAREKLAKHTERAERVARMQFEAERASDEGRASEIVPWSDQEELVSFHWEGRQAEVEGSSAGPTRSAERASDEGR